MNRIILMLPVRSMDASIEFYEKLGITVERRSDQWGWPMLRIEKCRLIVDQSINIHPDAARQSVVYLYPEDLKGYHHPLRENGLGVPGLTVTFTG